MGDEDSTAWGEIGTGQIIEINLLTVIEAILAMYRSTLSPQSGIFCQFYGAQWKAFSNLWTTVKARRAKVTPVATTTAREGLVGGSDTEGCRSTPPPQDSSASSSSPKTPSSLSSSSKSSSGVPPRPPDYRPRIWKCCRFITAVPSFICRLLLVLILIFLFSILPVTIVSVILVAIVASWIVVVASFNSVVIAVVVLTKTLAPFLLLK